MNSQELFYSLVSSGNRKGGILCRKTEGNIVKERSLVLSLKDRILSEGERMEAGSLYAHDPQILKRKPTFIFNKKPFEKHASNMGLRFVVIIHS